MKILIYLFIITTLGIIPSAAQQKAITSMQLDKYRKACASSPSERALDNAVALNGLKVLATSAQNNAYDTYFSNKVNSKGITNQQKSGRCWLFTGLNVLRAKIISRYNTGDFSFSQNYCFFYDQLEKSNLFLQSIIDNANKPMDDRLVEWLFKHPISDGGQFTGISDLITKYGLVPSDVMPETFTSNNTSDYAKIISLKLRENGLALRKMAAGGAKEKELLSKKEEMMETIYKILVRCFGMPPQKFTWTLKDSKGQPVSTKEYTPQRYQTRQYFLQ